MKEKFKKITEIFKIKDQHTLIILMTALFISLNLIMSVTSVIQIPLIPVGKLGLIKLNGLPFNFIEVPAAIFTAGLMMGVSSIIAECFDKKKTTLIISLGYLSGFALSILLLIFYAIAKNYPTNNFSLIIGGKLVAHFFPFDALAQNWRFMLSGFLAYVISAIVNVAIIWTLKKKHENKLTGVRVYFSSWVAQIVDDVLFLILAFAPIHISLLERSWTEIGLSIPVQIITEIVIEGLFLPLSLFIIKKIKQKGFYDSFIKETKENEIVIEENSEKKEVQEKV